MTISQFMNEIATMYDENDVSFAAKAIKKIQDYYAEMKPSTSKIDPNRLGSQAVTFSRIKQLIMEKVGPMDYTGPREIGAKEFNKMEVKDQLKFQAQARQDETFEGTEPRYCSA